MTRAAVSIWYGCSSALRFWCICVGRVLDVLGHAGGRCGMDGRLRACAFADPRVQSLNRSVCRALSERPFRIWGWVRLRQCFWPYVFSCIGNIRTVLQYARRFAGLCPGRLSTGRIASVSQYASVLQNESVRNWLNSAAETLDVDWASTTARLSADGVARLSARVL